MADLQNELTWSASRHGCFSSCRRRYYYNYYGSWGGWSYKATPECRELYMLKKMGTRHMWMGKVVHAAVQAALDARHHEQRVVDCATLKERVLQTMRQEFRNSREGAYRSDPKKYPGLLEHEYGEDVPDSEWKKLAEDAQLCVENLHAMPLWQELMSLDTSAWLEWEAMNGFAHRGLKVWAVLDFARRKGDAIEIYDWKTGKPREEAADLQMGVYSMYAHGKWQVPLEKISAHLVYVQAGKIVTHRPDAAWVERARMQMDESITAMKALLRTPTQVAIEDCPLTESIAECRQCAFRRLCGRT